MVCQDMKRQELIHIHALLAEIRTYLIRERDRSIGSFRHYDSQPVRPVHIHQGKQAHEDAIRLLLCGFDEPLRVQPPPKQRPPR